MNPPSEFSGYVACGSVYWTGNIEYVVVGAVAGGNLVRREIRGWEERYLDGRIEDLRLEGEMRVSREIDEYFAPGADFFELPALSTVTTRIENEHGSWHGAFVDATWPGRPDPQWERTVLTGEGGYAGLTAVLMSRYSEDPCGWDIRGVVFEGGIPPSGPATG